MLMICSMSRCLRPMTRSVTWRANQAAKARMPARAASGKTINDNHHRLSNLDYPSMYQISIMCITAMPNNSDWPTGTFWMRLVKKVA